MRHDTAAAMLSAVRLFREAWLHPNPSEAIWLNVANQMDAAWQAHVAELAAATGAEFDGRYYDPALDADRLRAQIGSVWNALADGNWHSLREISEQSGAPEASASAQIRHLRKARHGGWIISLSREGGRTRGRLAYRMQNPDGTPIPPITPNALRTSP